MYFKWWRLKIAIIILNWFYWDGLTNLLIETFSVAIQDYVLEFSCCRWWWWRLCFLWYFLIWISFVYVLLINLFFIPLIFPHEGTWEKVWDVVHYIIYSTNQTKPNRKWTPTKPGFTFWIYSGLTVLLSGLRVNPK